ncbi:MAG: hypothetical protein U0996_11770 [Planctomycetaceae bacterium]
MLNLLKALRQDEYGVILSTEIVIIGSILVIGLITGLTCLQKSVNEELKDVANAIGSLDQSYAFSGHQKPGIVGRCCAWTAGSSYVNCENGVTAQRSDIVGCCNQAVSTSSCGNCGTCNSCQSAVSVPAKSTCGTCGKAGCGGGCSSVGHHHSSHSFDVETGVSNVRVTETHLSPAAPTAKPCDDCPPSAVPAVPVIEDVNHLNPQPIPPAEHHHEVKPVPQTQPLPPAAPVPPAPPMPPQA